MYSTAFFHIQKQYDAHTAYLCVSHDPGNNQKLCPDTLTG